MEIESQDRIARIRELNDAFRRTFSGGKVMMTCGVSELPNMVKAKALQLVAAFDQFTEDNDPAVSMTWAVSNSSIASSFGRSITTTSAASSGPKTRRTLRRLPAS
jgi:hypothetical protein